MNRLIASKFAELDSMEMAQLIGSAHRYIANSAFLNALNLIDINSRNPREPRHYSSFCKMMPVFNGVPSLREEVEAWLDSV